MVQQNNEKGGKFRLVIQNDNEERSELTSVQFTKMKFLFSLVMILLFVLGLSYALISFTPIRKTIPGYPDNAFRQMAVSNSVKIDSLETVIAKWKIYADNVSRILMDQQTISLDSVVSGHAKRYLTNISEEEFRLQDSILRALVIEDEKRNLLSSQENKQQNIDAIRFYVPVKGLIINHFSPAINPGLDISVNPGDMVMSIMDGTVILAEWTDTDRYIIAVQHKGDLISIYKRNQRLLLSPGDFVKGGTPIALASGTGVHADNDHIHIELWDKGTAIDPEKYISFQ